MSKKQDQFYFNNFVACAEYACQAAGLLKRTLSDFDPGQMAKRLDELHEIERQADDTKHALTDRLAKAFITPIEREDIAALSHNIDEVTDKIEEVLIRIYINNVREIRKDALKLLEIVEKCCQEMKLLLEGFSNFRNSESMLQKVIRINTLEEEADALYISSMHSLHTKESEILQIIAWREIYDYLEKCSDACEHVADTVSSVVMKNS